MDRVRVVRLATVALATVVLLPAILLTGILQTLPYVHSLGAAVAIALPFDTRVPTTVVLIGGPLALGVSLVIRAAITRRPVDVVLAAFGVPCLLVSLWAVYEAVFTSPGLYWGGLFSIVAGSLLAFVVLVDAVVARMVGVERS